MIKKIYIFILTLNICLGFSLHAEESKNDILDFLEWGVRISFSGYRNRLRNEQTIKFTKDRYEVK